jgi:hypothetical protein
VLEANRFIESHPYRPAGPSGPAFADRIAWSLACYKVTFQDVEAGLQNEAVEDLDDLDLDEELGAVPVMPAEDARPALFSFGWLFADELIYYGRSGDASGGVSPTADAGRSCVAQ